LLKVVDCGAEAADWLKSSVVQPTHSGPAADLRLVYLVDDSRQTDKVSKKPTRKLIKTG